MTGPPCPTCGSAMTVVRNLLADRLEARCLAHGKVIVTSAPPAVAPALRQDREEALRDHRTQLEIIQEEFRRSGRVDAHEMLYRHGITRTAARIDELRETGWRIRTLPIVPGHMAVYELEDES